MKLFHSLLYPLLGGLFCLSCSDDEQDTGTKQPTTAGEVTFGVDLTGFSTRVTQDGSSWNDGDKIGTYVLDMKTLEPATSSECTLCLLGRGCVGFFHFHYTAESAK